MDSRQFRAAKYRRKRWFRYMHEVTDDDRLLKTVGATPPEFLPRFRRTKCPLPDNQLSLL